MARARDVQVSLYSESTVQHLPRMVRLITLFAVPTAATAPTPSATYSVMSAKKGNVVAVFLPGSYTLGETQDHESRCEKTRMHYEELVDRRRT